MTLVAAADAGYVFANWTEGGSVVSTSPSYTFLAHADRTLVANFVAVGAAKAITTSSQPANGGTTSGDGAYALGSSATVIATAESRLQVLQVAGQRRVRQHRRASTRSPSRATARSWRSSSRSTT